MLTRLQTQATAASLNALADNLVNIAKGQPNDLPNTGELLASLTHHIGPFICPDLADMLVATGDPLKHLPAKLHTDIETTARNLALELTRQGEATEYAATPIKQFLAQLLQQLVPILLPMILALLQQPPREQ